ncbi:MAG: T9SS type A sorting domain-containing protein [Chitinophagales bacterium]
MKTLILSLILVLLFYTKTQSQVYQYVPLIDSSAVMEWKGQCWFDVMHSSVNHINHYIIKGDTLLNGNSWRKLFIVNYNVQVDTVLTGAITETAGKKVYYKAFTDSANINGDLVYDFNLKIDDTLFRPGAVDEIMVIKNIDTVWGPLGYSKQFSLCNAYVNDTTFTDVWIEGVGSIKKGLFASRCWGNYGANIIVCSIYKDTQLLYSSSGNFCLGPLLSEESIQNIEWSVYPNPTNATLNVEATGVTAFNLSVFDLAGKKVAETKSAQTSITVELDNYAPGVYVVAISSKGYNTIYKKVIKQ